MASIQSCDKTRMADVLIRSNGTGKIVRVLQRECRFSSVMRSNAHGCQTPFALITHLLSILAAAS